MFKKAFCVMFCLYWFVSTCSFDVYSTDLQSIKTSVHCGDVNTDGETNSLDAALILKHDSGLAILDITVIEVADVNCDNKVNSLDAALILKYDAKIIEDFMTFTIPDSSLVVEESFEEISSTIESDESEEQTMYELCTLIVNGKDITVGNYVAMDSYSQFHLPLLAISRELGVDVEWINDSEVVLSNGSKGLSIDIEELNFGITPPNPPYDIGVYIREIVNDDIIMDPVSINWILSELVDFTLYLDSVTPMVIFSSSQV